ncbi:DUF211 domain-containing protein [Rhodococcus sp. NPDC003322]
MTIRRLELDVDTTVDGPAMVELARRLEAVRGVEGVTLTVREIDIETVGLNVAVEGPDIEVDLLFGAIEKSGAVLHNINQVRAGEHSVERATTR